MYRWFIAIIGVVCVLTCLGYAQADRNYVQGGAAYLSASGGLADSARMRSSMGYTIGYQWAPSRNWSFGMAGWFVPTEIRPFQSLSTEEPASFSTATVFSMSAAVSYRFFKHGLSPYVAAEAGFGFLTVADSLTQNNHVNPKLGALFAGSLGFLIPVSEHVDIDLAARYAQIGFGDGLTHLGGVAGLRYRLR